MCVVAIARYRADPPGQTASFRIWALGSGFFVAPHVLLTCNHVMNGARVPHQEGDKYQLIQNLGSGGVKLSPLFSFEIGKELQLLPDRDAAIIRVPGPAQPFASVDYGDAAEGVEIGVAGYPQSTTSRDVRWLGECGRGRGGLTAWLHWPVYQARSGNKVGAVPYGEGKAKMRLFWDNRRWPNVFLYSSRLEISV